MHATHRATAAQQRVHRHLGNADSYAMFNLLTGPELFDRVEALVPEHRERLFPPTETLSMFLAQALSADGSCRQVVNDAMVKRVVGGMTPGSTDTGGYCKARARLPLSMVSTLAREAGGKVMVTTFLCPKETPKSVLKSLYRQRWHVELDLRNIKTTLGMEHLRCKSPEMAIKELWVYLLAYNLIRLLMAQAALLADQIPRQLSFKHTVQIWMAWQHRGGSTHNAVSLGALLVLIAEPRVGLRPGRTEPRAMKRRPKPFPLLTKPRPTAREDIRLYGHPKKQR